MAIFEYILKISAFLFAFIVAISLGLTEYVSLTIAYSIVGCWVLSEHMKYVDRVLSGKRGEWAEQEITYYRKKRFMQIGAGSIFWPVTCLMHAIVIQLLINDEKRKQQ